MATATKKATPIAGTIQLGDRARDKYSGFTGIVEVVSEYLYQCRQISVRPEGLDKDGKLQTATWFDEPQLERLAAGGATTPGPSRSRRRCR